MDTSKFKPKSSLFDNHDLGLVEVEQVQESRHHHRHHRQSFSSTTQSTSISSTARNDAMSLRKAAVCSTSSSTSSSSSRSAQKEAALQVSRRNAVGHAASSKAFSTSTTTTTSSSTGSLPKLQLYKSSSASSTVTGATETNSATSITTASSTIRDSSHHRASLLPMEDDDEDVFLNTDSLFSSPHVRSLAKETWRDFAELENQALSTTENTNSSLLQSSNLNKPNVNSSLSTRLFGHRPLSPISGTVQYASIDDRNGGRNIILRQERWSTNDKGIQKKSSNLPTTRFGDWKAENFIEPDNDLISIETSSPTSFKRENELSSNGSKIKSLISKAQDLEKSSDMRNRLVFQDDEHQPDTIIEEVKDNEQVVQTNTQPAKNEVKSDNIKTTSDTKNSDESHKNHCKSVMSKSIERIDHRMSDLCKKLNECTDTKEAIDMLKIMIQMLEKAWSIPVCGDDLGFKLCNSLREMGGLDIILGFIHDYSEDQQLLHSTSSTLGKDQTHSFDRSSRSSDAGTITGSDICLTEKETTQPVVNDERDGKKNVWTSKNDPTLPPNPLRLKLQNCSQPAYEKKIPTSEKPLDHGDEEKSSGSSSNIPYDSLRLASVSAPSTSMISSDEDSSQKFISDSLSITTSSGSTVDIQQVDSDKNDYKDDFNDKMADSDNLTESEQTTEGIKTTLDGTGESTLMNDEEAKLRKEELVFLSARLLSQSLTSENRNYIVDNSLDSVIKLACNFTNMKGIQSHRLLSRSLIMRQSSIVSSSSFKQNTHSLGKNNNINNAIRSNEQKDTTNPLDERNPEDNNNKKLNTQQKQQDTQQTKQQQPPPPPTGTSSDLSDRHAIIGTEILQHLFKHSEATCSKMISSGGLQAILYGCRSTNIETLRHCASALANLALYGGPDGQEMMIQQKAHVWLFPLAFNEDDNIQYYACLAIVVLVANQEIEADVLKSSTLDLVEPFVTTHEPKKFAESTTSHIHGQSPSWLRRLIPLLSSKREEARNLACFHFAMEAYIKKEQGQAEVFKKIGAVEPLRKVGSSPKGIASKFACQALRLIGEPEPHKLSQQVPLWTTEDVIEWVNQVGFERYKQAFVESQVDGDLLLQIDEEMLKDDIGIENGITRRRFLRELSNLKQIADYSAIDRSGLISILCGGVSSAGRQSQSHQSNNEFIQYIYPIVQLGVTKDNIHLFEGEQLIRECKVSNSVHRVKLARAIKDLQEKCYIATTTSEMNSSDGVGQKTLDVFVSYRRANGSQLASLLKVHLQLRGFSVFIDVERLEAGKFDSNLLDSIKIAKNFILVLSPNALDRCIGDVECKDWIHKEIVAALASECNIIPIMDNFTWPEADQLPEDMRSITYFNGVRWIHDYQDACVDKVERFIRGEIYDGTGSVCGQSISSAQSGSLQRHPINSFPPSTPSILDTPSITSSSFAFLMGSGVRT